MTSDAGGTGNLITLHKVAGSREEAAKLSLERGLSVEMGGGGYVYETLPDSIRSGYVSEDALDTVVGHLLRCVVSTHSPHALGAAHH
jgi:beta-glucosidase